MLRNKELLQQVHKRFMPLASSSVNVTKKNGECVIATKGVNGILYVCFEFLSKGAYLKGMGGYFLITCYDYDGEWALHPQNFKNLVIYWSQLEKKEYDILLTMKSQNGRYLATGFDIIGKYENFINNAAAVHYWNVDDFYHVLDFLVDYTPRMISRHLQNPQFPLAHLWKSG